MAAKRKPWEWDGPPDENHSPGDFTSTFEEIEERDTYWKVNTQIGCDFPSKGCNIASTLKNIILMAKEATEILQKQNSSGGPRKIKDIVCYKLWHMTKHLEILDKSMEEIPSAETETRLTTPPDQRLTTIEQDIKDIKAALNLTNLENEIKEIKVAIHETPKTWANLVASKPNIEAVAKARVKHKQLQEKLKKERQPYEVTLTTTDEKTKKTLTTMQATEITKRCQQIVDNAIDEKPKINGINKIANGIRLQCKSPEDAKLLQKMVDWNTAFTGLGVHKPKYGIVIHGVSVKELPSLDDKDAMTATKQEWEDGNHGIIIKTIKYLRRKPRTDREPANRSIIAFTEDPHAADRCIKYGFFINSERHPAEKYAPQLHITQCYKCFEYGHRAGGCKRKEKCGNCSSEDHSTSERNSTEHRCCLCKSNSHQAWSPQCPERDAESRRLTDLRMETSPLFTS